MNKKNIFFTIAVSGLAFAVSYLISFFLTKYVTGAISTEAYGFISLAKTIASYVIIGTTALNSYSTRYISIAYHKGDYKRANEYFNSVLFSNIFVGFFLLAICLISIDPLVSLLKVPESIKLDVGVLFYLVFLNLFLTLASTAFQASAIIRNKLHIVSVFKLISYLTEGIILLALFMTLSPNVYYVGVGMVSGTLVLLSTYIVITKRQTPQLCISIRNFKLQSVKELCLNGMWNSFNSLGNTLNSGLDLIVANVMLGPFIMGQVSIVKTIVSIFNVLYTMVAQPFEPIFLKDYSNGEKRDLIYHLQYSAKISGLVSNLAFSGFVSLGLVYYRLWVPNQNTELLFVLTIVALLSSVLDGPIYPLYYIYTLTVKNRFPCMVTIAGGLANLISMIIMIRFFGTGIYAIFISTTIVMSIINGITNPLYMSKCLEISCKELYPTLLKSVLSCAIMTAVLYVFNNIVIKVSGWVGFAIAVMCSCIIGSTLHVIIVFGLKETIGFILGLLQKIKKKY